MKAVLVRGHCYYKGEKIEVGQEFDCSELWFNRNSDRLKKAESKPTPKPKAPEVVKKRQPRKPK